MRITKSEQESLIRTLNALVDRIENLEQKVESLEDSSRRHVTKPCACQVRYG